MVAKNALIKPINAKTFSALTRLTIKSSGIIPVICAMKYVIDVEIDR